MRIEEIDKACNIGYEMHTAAMRLCKPGVSEQYIAGILDGIAASYGNMVSFATILHRTDRHFTIMTTARFFRQAV